MLPLGDPTQMLYRLHVLLLSFYASSYQFYFIDYIPWHSPYVTHRVVQSQPYRPISTFLFRLKFSHNHTLNKVERVWMFKSSTCSTIFCKFSLSGQILLSSWRSTLNVVPSPGSSTSLFFSFKSEFHLPQSSTFSPRSLNVRNSPSVQSLPSYLGSTSPSNNLKKVEWVCYQSNTHVIEESRQRRFLLCRSHYD